MNIGTEALSDLISRAVPRPIGEPGTKEQFESYAAHRAFIAPHIREFAEFPRWRDRRVLELGCGIGADAVEFLRAGAEYTGLDVSRSALRQAKKWFRAAGVDAGLIHADAAQLMEHVRQASFDMIYCFDALHLMAEPDAVIRQARRAIRPDGEFRLMLPATESWTDAMTEAGLEPPDLPSGSSGFARSEARALLRANDFSATEITQDHIFPYVREAYLRGSYELHPWFAAMPPAMFRALERRFGRHMMIVARPS